MLLTHPIIIWTSFLHSFFFLPFSIIVLVITNPQIIKNTSTPINPDGSAFLFKWLIITAITAIALSAQLLDNTLSTAAFLDILTCFIHVLKLRLFVVTRIDFAYVNFHSYLDLPTSLNSLKVLVKHCNIDAKVFIADNSFVSADPLAAPHTM